MSLSNAWDAYGTIMTKIENKSRIERNYIVDLMLHILKKNPGLISSHISIHIGYQSDVILEITIHAQLSISVSSVDYIESRGCFHKQQAQEAHIVFCVTSVMR